MTRRLFWMGLGAGATVVVIRRVRKTFGPYAQAAAPVTGLVEQVKKTVGEIRTTMTEHEAELRAMLVEDAGNPDRPRSDPRTQPHKRSWTSGEDEDEELYSF